MMYQVIIRLDSEVERLRSGIKEANALDSLSDAKDKLRELLE